MSLRALLITIPAFGLFFTATGWGQQQRGEQDLEQQLQAAYAKHDAKIRRLLPPYSGPPLLLDLSHGRLEDGMCDPEQHVAWEGYFSEIMADTRIADLRFSKPSGATATTMVTIDTFAPSYSLPAKRSSSIVIGMPIAARVCIAQNHHYVYTEFTLDVLKEFKKGKRRPKEVPQKNRQITSVGFGGSVRFPSGYLETFLLSQRGFPEVGKQYVLFMWKPVPSDDTLVISQAYLIQDGLVFPVSADGDAQTVYTKMPLPEFEAKVRAAVERNADLDVLPDVHAPAR